MAVFKRLDISSGAGFTFPHFCGAVALDHFTGQNPLNQF